MWAYQWSKRVYATAITILEYDWNKTEKLKDQSAAALS